MHIKVTVQVTKPYYANFCKKTFNYASIAKVNNTV